MHRNRAEDQHKPRHHAYHGDYEVNSLPDQGLSGMESHKARFSLDNENNKRANKPREKLKDVGEHGKCALVLRRGCRYFRIHFFVPRIFTPAKCLLSQQFKISSHRFNAAIKIRQVEFLVGRVKIIIGQAESHHHRGRL